jgi:hypothetical protein
VALVTVALIGCRPAPGPVEDGFSGVAYAVPDGTGGPDHLDQIPVELYDESGTHLGSDHLAAGQPVSLTDLEGEDEGSVSFPWSSTVTAVAAGEHFWAVPSFVDLKDLTVTIDGAAVALGESGVRYERGTVASFDDPATPGHDGIALATRRFLACTTSQWSIGNQTYTTDLVELGVHRRDKAMVDAGVKGLDFGVSLPVNSGGVHQLYRACDGTTVADYGGSHHTTQWLESLGRGVYLLAGSPWAGEYRSRIDRYVERMEELATLLTVPANRDYWHTRWLVDANGNVFTHKTYMRAAALGLTATLTDDAQAATRWTEEAAVIAQFGMDQQRTDGVNPERGGYDVNYQMYGTWLAQVYRSTLAPWDPLWSPLQATIERAMAWMDTRIDPSTGAVDIVGSTRTCTATDGYSPYEPAPAVRAYLHWGQSARPNMGYVAQALLIDAGHKATGNPCPPQ